MSLTKMKRTSIINLYSEMQNAYSNGLQGYEWLASKCNNQATLASTTRKGKQIIKMSVNSFKKYSNLTIDGGFNAIDSLREKINEEYKGVNFRTNESKQPVNKLEKLHTEISMLKRNQTVLIRAYNDLNRITLDLIAKDSSGNTLEYQKHQDLFSEYFGLDLVVDNEH